MDGQISPALRQVSVMICPWCELEGADTPEQGKLLKAHFDSRAVRSGIPHEIQGRWHWACWDDAAEWMQSAEKVPE